MSSTTKRNAVAPWKKLLLEAQELRGQAGITAHRRATILVSLFEDQDFRAEACASDDDKVIDMLDGLVEDLCLNFGELKAMLGEFPAADDWADGKLATLYDKAITQIRSRQKGDPRPARPRSAYKELAEIAEKSLKDVECQLQISQRQVASAVSRLDQLEKENQELKAENAMLKGRIIELERQRDGVVRHGR